MLIGRRGEGFQPAPFEVERRVRGDYEQPQTSVSEADRQSSTAKSGLRHSGLTFAPDRLSMDVVVYRMLVSVCRFLLKKKKRLPNTIWCSRFV